MRPRFRAPEEQVSIVHRNFAIAGRAPGTLAAADWSQTFPVGGAEVPYELTVSGCILPLATLFLFLSHTAMAFFCRSIFFAQRTPSANSDFIKFRSILVHPAMLLPLG